MGLVKQNDSASNTQVLDQELGSSTVLVENFQKRRVEETRLLATWLYQKTKNTKEAYESDIQKFLKYFPNISLNEVTTSHIGVYLKQCGHLQKASLARIKSTLSSLFKYLVKLNYIERNPADNLDSIKVADQTQFRVLSHEEIKRMVKLEPSFRNQVIIRLLYKTGMRVSELCSLKFSNLRERDGEYYLVVIGKGNKTRTIGIDDEIYSSLLGFRIVDAKKLSLDSFIFRSKKSTVKGLSRHMVSRLVNHAAVRAGASELATPHWLRHSHATKALELGEDLRVIQQTLGHDSIVTTTKYTKVFPGKNSGQKIEI